MFNSQDGFLRHLLCPLPNIANYLFWSHMEQFDTQLTYEVQFSIGHVFIYFLRYCFFIYICMLIKIIVCVLVCVNIMFA